ncbi:hypothetical protein RHMOL_Rhmol03G0072200 [Rhododendron molle]|uniref:Uncharacterized protein n=1 Tax=Rhododendron molle TaxID=49168 RepID=A0ACC0PB95_RHOML|nr:hypothetical protein RHMOL_Rhmol03G0072200 [Rhododendron molle]
MNVEQRHQREFPSWFEKHMIQLRKQNSPEATDDLYSLALGPDRRVTRCSGCIVNGTRFHTRDRERLRITQNSGIVVKGEHRSEVIDFYEVGEEDDNNDEVFQGDEVDVEVDGVPIQVEDREVTTLCREDLVADTVDQSEIVTGNCLDELNLSATDDEEDDTMADYCTDNDQEDEFTDDDDDD